MAAAFEPRTSLERALIDSDPEGQLYLEARRQQALDRLTLDHLDHHRLSRLSTITPPSSAPSSAASSIHEPRMGSHERSLDQPSFLSYTLGEQSPMHHQLQLLQHQPGSTPLQTPFIDPECTSTSLPHALSRTSSREPTPERDFPSYSFSSKHHRQPFPPPTDTLRTMRKARQSLLRKRNEKHENNPASLPRPTNASPSSSSAAPSPPPQQSLSFAPTSFEYQLTASLLAHPSPSSTRQPQKKTSQSSFTKRTRRRGRQGSQPYSITIDTSRVATATGGRNPAVGGGIGGLSGSRVDGKATAAMLAVEPMAPFSTDDSPPSTWSPSPPASPFGGSALEGSGFASLRAKASASALSTPKVAPTWPGVVVEPPLGIGNNFINTIVPSCSNSSAGVQATADDRHSPSLQPARNTSIPLPPIPPSPPLPPIPPKSSSSLIAHYFPGSLPPPPPRVISARPRRGSGAVLDSKTPTFSEEAVSASNVLSVSGQSSSSPLRLNVKTPTFGPAVFVSTEGAPPVPAIPHSVRPALLHMAAMTSGDSSDSVVPRSQFMKETVVTASVSASSSHPALVSTSALGVVPPNTTVAINMPYPLPKAVTTIASSSLTAVSDDVEANVDSTNIPTTYSTSLLPSAEPLANNNNTPTTASFSAATSGSPILAAAPRSSSPQLFSPMRPRPPLRRPSMTPHVSFEGQIPSAGISATAANSGVEGAGAASTSTTATGVGLFYPTGLKDRATAGPSALLGSKLSPHYYHTLYQADSTNSSTSSLYTRGGGSSAESGTGGNSAKSNGKGKRKRKRKSKMPGSNTSISLDPRMRILSMTSSELDPLHYLENKPLPAVKPLAPGGNNADLEGEEDGGHRFISLPCFRRPPTRHQERLWVLRDQDGWMIGPLLFLLGFLFPPLWWIGGFYRARPPTDKKRPASPLPRPTPKKHKERMIKLLQLFRGVGGIWRGEEEAKEEEEDREKDSTRRDQKVERSDKEDCHQQLAAEEGQLHSGAINSPVSAPPSPLPPLNLADLTRVDVETPDHGPWAVEHMATHIFQERMVRDRRARRARIEIRWRTVNLIFAFLSVVIAVAVCAVVIAAL